MKVVSKHLHRVQDETGFILIHAVFVSTVTGLMAFAFLSQVLSNSLTSSTYMQAELAMSKVDSALQLVRWMIITPPSANGWGIRMTTAPSNESIDYALAKGHFKTLGETKVIIQRTKRPWERRVSLAINTKNGRIEVRRVVQSIMHIDISGGEQGASNLVGTPLVLLDPLDGPMPFSTVVSTNLKSGPGTSSPAVWVGHQRELSLWSSTVSGDVWTHLPIMLDPWSGITGDELVADSWNQHNGLFPELEPPGLVATKTVSSGEMFVVQGFPDSELKSKVGALVCSDHLGRLHVSVDNPGCGSDIDLLVDEWSESPADGILAVFGDVTVDGSIPAGWSVIAFGGSVCPIPCGKVTQLSRGISQDVLGESVPQLRGNGSSIEGGWVSVVAMDEVSVLTSDVIATLGLETTTKGEFSGVSCNLIMDSTLIVGGDLRLGGPDHGVTLQGKRFASDALDYSRTGIRPRASIQSFIEVLPAPN